jgi:cytochrome c oxidase assembly protein subunit 15
MQFSKGFVRWNWVALVFIYLIFVAGSLVRITGSGMGCPDWPKCFGQWVPPTEASALPEDYKDVFSEKRAKKIEKFSSLLDACGMASTAHKLRTDKSLLEEEDFNARKTWTEYINRLVGFIAGNMLLLAFLWMLVKYRKHRKLLFIAAFNLVLMAIQAWFGSIVVATNLVPWTITIHMFLGLLIVGIQIYILRLISPSQQKNLSQSKPMIVMLWAVFLITAYQMFLGTQVREEIDALIKLGYSREQWLAAVGWPFYVHRSFSWLVLVALGWMTWKNEKTYRSRPIRWVAGLLIAELLSGILLAHVDMPAIVQTMHLIFASVMFGVLTMLVFRSRGVSADTA